MLASKTINVFSEVFNESTQIQLNVEVIRTFSLVAASASQVAHLFDSLVKEHTVELVN